ncbi:DUF4255 domain-containing protein [Sorangium sp. So ce117]|uniref:DUF4255 domain-containing protein n=1 Tax=Sorangium sp. So ce117 TaxID=3133277 RepID=UPI003F616A52
MADARAILDTSRALQQILQDGLSLLPILPAQIKIESLDLLPDPVPPPRITLFLFNIHEDPYLSNQSTELHPTRNGTVEVVDPPVFLDLDYMICAWATTTDEELQLLGDVIRVLNDHPQLDAPLLGPAWRPGEAVHLALVNPPIEEQARIWSAFGFKRFKLSLYYRARSVPIQSGVRRREALVQAPAQNVRPQDPPPAGGSMERP